MLRWRLTAAGLLAALMLFPIGCGKGGDDSLLPVTGKVTYEGPLTTGTVILVADSARGNTTKHEPRGPIDAQENFQVATAGKPGAPAGWYKVAVIANKPGDPNNPYAPAPSLIPDIYRDANTSGLSFEVVKKPAEGAYNLNLK